MDAKTVTEVFKEQIRSSHRLVESNDIEVASIQTLRMSLIMLKSILGRNELTELFHLYDRELEFLLLDEEEYNEAYIDDNHEAEGECCVKREEFSEDEKEDSEWASRISAVCTRDKCKVASEKGKEEEVAIKDLLFYKEGSISVPQVGEVGQKLFDFILDLSMHHIAIRDFEKLEEVLNVYEGESETIIRSSNILKFIFDHGCGDLLLSYLK